MTDKKNRMVRDTKIHGGVTMFEKEANLYASIMAWDEEEDTWETIAERAYKDGAEFGYNKAMQEWRDCFMSCSSPYCADKFRDIQCGGILGNMTKEVRDGSVE